MKLPLPRRQLAAYRFTDLATFERVSDDHALRDIRVEPPDARGESYLELAEIDLEDPTAIVEFV